MASYTKTLNLLKKDPVADASDTFNIQTMLNDNWDKIDKAMAAARSAEEYDAAGTYAVGDYCTHDGKLYKCTEAITAGEAWTAAHWAETSVGAELTAMLAALRGKQNKLTAGDNVSISDDNVISTTGGLLPQIIITTDAGAVATATYGAQTVTGTVDSNGTCTLIIPTYGTWICVATKGGDTSLSESVTVDTVKQYTANCPFVPATFAGATWEQVKAKAAIVAAKYAEGNPIWNIGDKKPITLSTGQTVNVRIIDFNHDVDENGNTIPITFDIEDCLNTTMQMNSTKTNAGGWASCALRSALNSTILEQLPSDLRAVITAAAKKTSAGSQSSAINTSIDKLWLFSEVELYLSIYLSFAGEGTHYPIFSSNEMRIRTINGNDSRWWQRSPFKSNSEDFCMNMDGSGGGVSFSANGSEGVAFAFCI